MTVLGLGLDVVDVPGFAAQLTHPGSAFAEAAFTDRERGDARVGPTPESASLAARFAAKEAFVKAWSAARAGRDPALAVLDLREIEILRDPYGRPSLTLHGAVERALADGLPGARAHVSISHDGPTAAAVVVLEAATTAADAAPPLSE